jgi:hypothetical protein
MSVKPEDCATSRNTSSYLAPFAKISGITLWLSGGLLDITCIKIIGEQRAGVNEVVGTTNEVEVQEEFL